MFDPAKRSSLGSALLRLLTTASSPAVALADWDLLKSLSFALELLAYQGHLGPQYLGGVTVLDPILVLCERDVPDFLIHRALPILTHLCSRLTHEQSIGALSRVVVKAMRISLDLESKNAALNLVFSFIHTEENKRYLAQAEGFAPCFVEMLQLEELADVSSIPHRFFLILQTLIQTPTQAIPEVALHLAPASTSMFNQGAGKLIARILNFWCQQQSNAQRDASKPWRKGFVMLGLQTIRIVDYIASGPPSLSIRLHTNAILDSVLNIIATDHYIRTTAIISLIHAFHCATTESAIRMLATPRFLENVMEGFVKGVVGINLVERFVRSALALDLNFGALQRDSDDFGMEGNACNPILDFFYTDIMSIVTRLGSPIDVAGFNAMFDAAILRAFLA